jgi:glycosyltransferase involved in cell wall biosynthesis
MKILLISLFGKGGMIHYSSQLANSLAKRSQVSVIVPTECDISYFSKDVNIITLNAPRSYILTALRTMNLKMFYVLKSKIDEINPDVIHFLNNHPWSGLLGYMLKKYPILTTVHDINPHYGTSLPVSLSLKATNRLLFSVSQALIVHGVNLKEELLKKHIPGDRIFVIPHGDYSFFLNYCPNVESIDNNILFFGRILPYKGLTYLIESEKILRKKNFDYSITIAGEGDISPYNALLDDLSRYEIINEYIPDEKVAELFTKTSIVVLPYIEGSQTGIIPIAYSFRKPVVVSDVGSLPEVVDAKKTGLIIPPKSSQALADALEYLLTHDRERESMGISGYEKMRDELSWDKIGLMTYDVYSKIYNG